MGEGAAFGSYPKNLVPLGPSWSTGLTRLSPSLRAGSFLGRCSLLRSQDNETHTQNTQVHSQEKRTSLTLSLASSLLVIEHEFIA